VTIRRALPFNREGEEVAPTGEVTPVRRKVGMPHPEVGRGEGSSFSPRLGLPVLGKELQGLDPVECSFEERWGLELPEEPSSCPHEAGEEDDWALGLFLCISLFLLFEQNLTLREEPATSTKTTLVLRGV
jgi:hypothetical protein